MTRARGTLLLAGVLLFAGCASSSSARRPSIALIVIDTVRADRLSCYGYERPTTPRIDELCARGIRFANAVSTSSWTLPAHASLFTGLYPIRHGATQEYARLDAGPPTLAEVLGAQGYATFGVSANPLVGTQTGLDRGFDAFVDGWRGAKRAHYRDPRKHPNLRAAARFLEVLDPQRPFFLFVNYIEAHGPYTPPEPYRSKFLSPGTSEDLVGSAATATTAGYYIDPSSITEAEFAVLSDLYDGEIAYLDSLVGALVDYLEQSGRMRDTLLVVTSDHGENLGEHGHFRHIFNLYGSAVRIPLIFRLPGDERAGEVRPEAVGLVDVFATLVAQARASPPTGSDTGRDLLAVPSLGASVPLFAEYYTPKQARGLFSPEELELHEAVLHPYLNRRLRSVELDGLRLIVSSNGERELYDLHRDPGELTNVAGAPSFADEEGELAALLGDLVGREHGASREPAPPAEGPGDFDEESRERLRELGYLR